MVGILDLIGNIVISAYAWTGNIQNEMDASYQEKSMLTNLFTEHKFLGWAGLLFITYEEVDASILNAPSFSLY